MLHNTAHETASQLCARQQCSQCEWRDVWRPIPLAETSRVQWAIAALCPDSTLRWFGLVGRKCVRCAKREGV